MTQNGLTHFNDTGDAHMVNVGGKKVTHRVAIAEGFISMKPDTLQTIMAGTNKKGDVLGIARIAGIMAAKKTADLIPLCHPLPLTRVVIDLDADNDNNQIRCQATTETNHITGVEMEALTAVQCTLLTIYDMCKAVDKGMEMKATRLIYKAGGKSGTWKAQSDK